MAHEIPYVATATVADLRDLEYKATRAMDFHGARYLHILVPCPLGWGSSPADTVKVARLATESGLFPVFEAEDGQVVSATPIRRQVPVTDYLRLQSRYAHLFRPQERTEVIARIQASADRSIARFGLLDNPTPGQSERVRLSPIPDHDSARRCMSCGNCFGCDNCYGACPDNAVIKVDAGQYVIDYDYCKGCGICAAECPCGSIAMVPEDG